jgi:hypothetical protein
MLCLWAKPTLNMKKAMLLLIVLLPGILTYAQSNGGTESGREGFKSHHAKDAPFYITVSSGLNNNTGIFGVTLELPVSKNVSLEAGIGEGTWGYKAYLGGKYFLRPHHLGWAFGAGITYCGGLNNFQENLNTVSGYTEPVVLDLNPQTNFMLAAYRYWRLGRGANRIYMELGYSVRLTGGDLFDQQDNGSDPIDDNSANTIKLLAPGGLIAALGFSFGIR